MNLHIQLQKFEGPLALLLYLIRKEEMDIFDIKINEITKQYLEYIKLMQELDLDLAGEFVAMASTLIQIKSRMLLPQYNEQGEIIEQEDPRKELVQRLLEYQKYQDVSKQLYERPLLGRDVWGRGIREKLEAGEEEILLEDNALFSLISAYRSALRSIKKKAHQVAAKTQSIAQRILEMRDRLLVGQRVAMSDLVEQLQDKRKQVLITFLSLLELGKMGFVNLYQTENYSEIYVEARKAIETDMLSRVEEYDSMRAEDIAAEMMDKAQKISPEDDFDLVDEPAVAETAQLTLAIDGDESTAEPIDELASDDEILAAELEIGNV